VPLSLATAAHVVWLGSPSFQDRYPRDRHLESGDRTGKYRGGDICFRKISSDSQLTRLYYNGASGEDLKDLESRANLREKSRIDGKQSKSDAFSSPLSAKIRGMWHIILKGIGQTVDSSSTLQSTRPSSATTSLLNLHDIDV
jgi:hypothetical protein